MVHFPNENVNWMTSHPVYILKKNYKLDGGHPIHIFICKCESDDLHLIYIFIQSSSFPKQIHRRR